MDVGIRGDVIGIIQDDERVLKDRAVERDCHRRQQKAENGVQLLACNEWPCFRKFFWVQPLARWDAGSGESLGPAHFVYPIVHSPRKRPMDRVTRSDSPLSRRIDLREIGRKMRGWGMLTRC